MSGKTHARTICDLHLWLEQVFSNSSHENTGKTFAMNIITTFLLHYFSAAKKPKSEKITESIRTNGLPNGSPS